MGCDIHVFAEKQIGQSFEYISYFDDPGSDEQKPLSHRSYGVFGFLADVRNYSAVMPISQQRGMPWNACDEAEDAYERMRGDAHSASWLTIDELNRFDYDQEMEDRHIDPGGATCDPGQGQRMTYRQFLGPNFFIDLKRLNDARATRIVFFFDC